MRYKHEDVVKVPASKIKKLTVGTTGYPRKAVQRFAAVWGDASIDPMAAKSKTLVKEGVVATDGAFRTLKEGMKEKGWIGPLPRGNPANGNGGTKPEPKADKTPKVGADSDDLDVALITKRYHALGKALGISG